MTSDTDDTAPEDISIPDPDSGPTTIPEEPEPIETTQIVVADGDAIRGETTIPEEAPPLEE